MGSGSSSTGPLCYAATVAQEWTNPYRAPSGFCVFISGSRNPEGSARRSLKEEEMRGTSVCLCWVASMRTQFFFKNVGAWLLFSTEKARVWECVCCGHPMSTVCSNTRLERKAYGAFRWFNPTQGIFLKFQEMSSFWNTWTEILSGINKTMLQPMRKWLTFFWCFLDNLWIKVVGECMYFVF